MLSKRKLKKVEAILQRYLDLFDSQKTGKHNMSTVPLAYASGLNLLVKNSTFKNEIVNKQNRIKNAKIVRAAKNLVIQFEDFGISSYAKLTDTICDNIQTLNGKSKLSPSKEAIMANVDDKFNDYELECSAFYSSLLIDIFNQGRQHQTVATPNPQVTFRKFAIFEQADSECFDTLVAHLKDELFSYLDYFKSRATSDVERCLADHYSKPELLVFMGKQFSKHSRNVQALFRKHCWQAYSFGNLYQLEKDKVRYVAWKTGQHIDDCLTCRAFQTGEAILKNETGDELPHKLVGDTVIYNINDIRKTSKLDGPAFFCHDDCRCQWVKA